jgi:hypothetical protein
MWVATMTNMAPVATHRNAGSQGLTRSAIDLATICLAYKVVPPTSCSVPARRSALAVVGVTVALVGVAVACTGGPGNVLKGDPTTLVRTAADRTIAAHTAAVSVSLGVATGPGLVGTGVVDFPLNQAQLTFLRTGARAKSHDQFDLVVDGPDAYLGGVVPGVSGPAGFVSGALADVAKVAKDRISPLDGLLYRPAAGMDLALLRGATKVLPYGGEEVQGTSTLRFSFVIDLAAASTASPVSQRPALDAAARALGDVQEPADVWLDSQGRVRRLQFASDPKLRTTTTKGGFFLEDGEYLSFIDIDFFNFGSPAPVTIPVLNGGPQAGLGPTSSATGP